MRRVATHAVLEAAQRRWLTLKKTSNEIATVRMSSATTSANERGRASERDREPSESEP